MSTPASPRPAVTGDPPDVLTAARHALTLAEAAEAVGVNPSTVSKWTLHGVGGVRLRSLKVGGRRRVTPGDLAAFVAALNGAAA